MRQQEHAITSCYEAKHQLRTGDFTTIEEYRNLRDEEDEGTYVLRCWALGGELTPPDDPYAEKRRCVRND